MIKNVNLICKFSLFLFRGRKWILVMKQTKNKQKNEIIALFPKLHRYENNTFCRYCLTGS